MATVTTHKGGDFYNWYVSVYGYGPPATVDSDAARYLAWQQGIPKDEAALIPYGAMGDPGLYIAGGALLTTPAPTVIPPQPPPAAPIAIAPGVGAAGGTLAPSAPTPPAPAGGGGATAGGGPTAGTASGLPEFTQEELDNINTVLSIGYKLGASALAIRAACCAGSGENHWSNLGCNSSDHCGLWQIGSSWQLTQPYSNLSYWTTYAYRDGFYGGFGGLIKDAAANPSASPGWLANRCHGAYADLTQGADYYNGYLSEADEIIAVYGPRAKVGGGPNPVGSQPVGATQPSAPAPSTGGVFNLFESLNWAGDFDNLWKYVMGGSNEAAHLADEYKAKFAGKPNVIGWQ